MPGKKSNVTALPQPALDPKSINSRLYNQVSVLLDQLETNEHVTMRERIQALVAIGRIQIMFVGLRKEKSDEPDRGSSVRKYAAAFAANDARRRAERAGSAEAARDEDEDIVAQYAGDDSDDDDPAA